MIRHCDGECGNDGCKIAYLEAEIERLRSERDLAVTEREYWVDFANTVAEQQRGACASEARFYAGFGWDAEKVEEKVRATPLVTGRKNEP